jgi:hypothetical protein
MVEVGQALAMTGVDIALGESVADQARDEFAATRR